MSPEVLHAAVVLSPFLRAAPVGARSCLTSAVVAYVVARAASRAPLWKRTVLVDRLPVDARGGSSPQEQPRGPRP